MKMICDVPDEVIKSVRMGTWCGSSVAEKMITNGIPLDEIRAEIERLQKMCDKDDLNLMAQYSAFGMVLDILDKYKAETEE